MSPSLRAILEDPLTWVAIAMSGGLSALLIWWFAPGFLVSLGVLGVGAFTLLAWVSMAAREGRYAARMRAMRSEQAEAAAERRADRLATLDRDLHALGIHAGAAQLQELGRHHEALLSVVDRRIAAGQASYTRYRRAAEQVYLSSIDNLSEVVLALRSVSTVDREALEARLVAMRDRGDGAPSVAAIAERLDLHDAQQTRAARLLAANEEALTALIKTATVLAEIGDQHGEARLPADVAVSELERLAERSRLLAAD